MDHKSHSLLARSIAIILLLASDGPALQTLAPKNRLVARAAERQRARPAAQSVPVLVELFTSEGCSTCPPADKLLADLDRDQPIDGVQVVALSEHVDYWNRLGWKDPFSSAEFSRRQTEYARVLGVEDPYTPQMIVDGRTQFVGSNAGTARDAISQAGRRPKADVNLEIKTPATGSVTVAVRIESIPRLSRGDQAEVMLAITEGNLISKVARGENSGRSLAHSAVARRLIKIGTAETQIFASERSIDLHPRWKRRDLRAVVFVQERSSRRVLGASSIDIPAAP